MLEYKKFTKNRITNAKRAFTTRRVPAQHMKTIISGNIKPVTGNLVLATVHEIGKHTRIEKPNGRRSLLMPGDEIIVCYGNRYAPDQFEAFVSEDLGLCDLVAGGGVASREVNRHDRMLPPTKIMPIGLIGDDIGNPLNLYDYRINDVQQDNRMQPIKTMKVFLVTGTAMNSGKTFTAASVIRGLKENGYKVAGIKATGTGSGGDLWKMKDMGADIIMDFTDAGYTTTYKIPDAEIEQGVLNLIKYAAKRKCDYAIVEIADGLQHKETATLIRSEKLKNLASGVIFAAYDSLGARAGHEELKQLGYSVLAISGQITRSPLAMREAATTNCNIYTPFEIQAGALVAAMSGQINDENSLLTANQVKQKTTEENHHVVNDSNRPAKSFWLRDAGVSHDMQYADDMEANV